MPRDPSAQAAADFIDKSETHRCLHCTGDYFDRLDWLVSRLNPNGGPGKLLPSSVTATWFTDAELIAFAKTLGYLNFSHSTLTGPGYVGSYNPRKKEADEP